MLDLGDVVAAGTMGEENTKNVLRNFGSAQNRYILYHNKAKRYIEERVKNI
jgi:hypothetical protein